MSMIQFFKICTLQGRIQDLIRGGAPDRDRPKTAILGPQFCRILVLGPHFWWPGGGPGPRGPPPGSAPDFVLDNEMKRKTELGLGMVKSATPISSTMEEKMWCMVVLGEENATQLCETVMYLLGVNLALGGRGWIQRSNVYIGLALTNSLFRTLMKMGTDV